MSCIKHMTDGACHECKIELLEKEIATLKASLPKIKADAVLDYEESLSSFHWTADEYIKNKLEAGE